MADFLLELPKAELHVHLEGAIQPETLYELDPETPLEQLRGIYRYADFDGFLKAFAAVSKRLSGPAAYALATTRLLQELERQKVRYAEITLAAGVVLWKQQEFGPIFEAVREVACKSPVQVQWILDAVRQFGPEHVMRVAELAAERVGQGVVALGIGGSEERGPAEWFAGAFVFARQAGLHLVAHAGETGNADSIRAALRLGAERIGHGIAAAADPELMRELCERDIPLEVCITSNVVTGVVKSLDRHPVRRLFDAGVPIILNTDDPAMFGCTLVGEYRVAQELGFSLDELSGLARNGFRYAFGPIPR
jgi:adenosine deaminase/aminodeoxyfutalosine deaminase